MLIADVIRNASLDAICALLDGCSIKFYEGANPAALATAHSGTLLGELTFGSPAFDSATSGHARARAIDPEYAVADGDLESFRIFTAGSGAECIAQGSCGELWEGSNYHNTDDAVYINLPLGHGWADGWTYNCQVLWEVDGVMYGRIDVSVFVSSGDNGSTFTFTGGHGDDWPATGNETVRVGRADLLFDGVDVTESVTRIAIDTGNLILLMASST